MPKTISLTHSYDAPSATVWAMATDYEALAKVMEGLVSFEGLPEGRIEKGQHLEVMVSLFGKLPAQPYTMDLLEFDDDEMRFKSSEVGAGVKSWVHELQVVAVGQGCEIREKITVDAGLLTPVFAAWARFMYKRRHGKRLALLAQ